MWLVLSASAHREEGRGADGERDLKHKDTSAMEAQERGEEGEIEQVRNLSCQKNESLNYLVHIAASIAEAEGRCDEREIT